MALSGNTVRANWGDEAANTLAALPVKANVNLWAHGLVVSDAGYAAPGRVATGLIAVGVAVKQFDNRTAATGGAAGAITATIRRGTFKFKNSAAGDAIAQTDFGKLAYIIDNETVAKTDGTGARSVAGIVEGVDADGGVWITVGLRAVAAS